MTVGPDTENTTVDVTAEALAAAAEFMNRRQVQIEQSPPVVISAPEVRQFISRKPNVRFTIDSDTFEAFGAAPADFMEKLVTQVGDIQAQTRGGAAALSDGMGNYRNLREAISVLLTPDSGKLFNSRCASFDNPITFGTAIDVATYLMEAVSGRPTQPQPPSAGPSPASATTSTAGVPDADSIPAISPGSATST